MYCTHCGSEIEIGAKFCTNCGAPVEEQGKETDYGQAAWEEKPAPAEEAYEKEEAYVLKPESSIISDRFMLGEWDERYLWLLAVLPLLNIVGVGSFLNFVLGVLMVVLDYKQLQKRNGLKLSLWVVILGALFNFVYLIARPHGTSKNYKPLIVFFVICIVLSLLKF